MIVAYTIVLEFDGLIAFGTNRMFAYVRLCNSSISMIVDCQGKCNCADCLRKRGKDPYNPEHVFDSTLASVQSFAGTSDYVLFTYYQDTAIDVNDKWASSIDMKPPRPQIHLFKKKNKEEADVLEYSPNGKTSKRRSLSKDLKKVRNLVLPVCYDLGIREFSSGG